MADEVQKLTGEERIDAIVTYLEQRHGYHFPPEVLPEQEEEVAPESDDELSEQGEEEEELPVEPESPTAE